MLFEQQNVYMHDILMILNFRYSSVYNDENEETRKTICSTLLHHSVEPAFLTYLSHDSMHD